MICRLCNKSKPPIDFLCEGRKAKRGATYPCKECHNKRSKSQRKFMREYVLSRYSGGVPHCACCGETNLAFLTLDHKNPLDKSLGVSHVLYSKLANLGFPPGYQVLCYNCNCGKRDNAFCPHELAPRFFWEEHQELVGA
jgi:hypothetical protein